MYVCAGLWLRACSAGTCGGQRALDVLELELQAGGEPPDVGAGNCTRILCRNSVYTKLLNLSLASLQFVFIFYSSMGFHTR